MQRHGLFLFFIFLVGQLYCFGESSVLELSPKSMVSPGTNKMLDGILHIHRGRGSDMSWVIQSTQSGQVEVTIEYRNSEKLDQPYQFAFGDKTIFWDVPAQKKEQWKKNVIGSFSTKANEPIWIAMAPPSNRKYDHAIQFKRLILKMKSGDGKLIRMPHFKEPKRPDLEPGFGQELVEAHPGLSITDVTPKDQPLSVTGIHALGQNRALITVLDGELYRANWNEFSAQLKLIAKSQEWWMDALQYKNRLFVLAKTRIIELKDRDKDGFFETHLTLADDWESSSDYHEYTFGSIVKENHLYFMTSVPMAVRSSHNRQVPLRGSARKVNLTTGKSTVIAGGLRTPNGMCMDKHSEIFLSDNQGEWLPSSKIIHLQQNAFYGFKSRPKHPFDQNKTTPPALWLPHGDVALSPTEPLFLGDAWGPYSGQGIIGDAAKKGLRRFFLEKINGQIQGAVFRWSQGLDFKINRLENLSSSSFIAGRLARKNNWDKSESVDSLKIFQFTDKVPFEIRSIKAASDGFEMEFTQPLARQFGHNINNVHLESWRYIPTQLYGGKKLHHQRMKVEAISLSDDRRCLFMRTPHLEPGCVVYFRLPSQWTSESGESLWSGEAWYTLNQLPQNNFISIKSVPANDISEVSFFEYQSKVSATALFSQYCSGCHSRDKQKLVGPSFHHSLGQNRNILNLNSHKKECVDFTKEYIHESILAPNAKVVEGYHKDLMPSFGSILSKKQIKLLTDYIYTLSQPKK